MHDELRVEHSTQVFHSQRFRWRLWVPLSLFRLWLWSFSRSLHCRSTGSLIHFCKKTKYSALALTTGLTIYHRRLFAKSTPHGDVAFQTCTRVELRHLEVETAAVSICDPTAFAFARAEVADIKGMGRVRDGAMIGFPSCCSALGFVPSWPFKRIFGGFNLNLAIYPLSSGVGPLQIYWYRSIWNCDLCDL